MCWTLNMFSMTLWLNIMTFIFLPRCRWCLVLTQKYNIPEQQYRDPRGHWWRWWCPALQNWSNYLLPSRKCFCLWQLVLPQWNFSFQYRFSLGYLQNQRSDGGTFAPQKRWRGRDLPLRDTWYFWFFPDHIHWSVLSKHLWVICATHLDPFPIQLTSVRCALTLAPMIWGRCWQ